MGLGNELVGMNCALSRHWGILLPGFFVSKARHLLTYGCHVYTFIAALCFILCFCCPCFYCGCRFILDFLFSLHFPLAVVRSLIHCAQVCSVCSARLSAGLSCLQNTLAAQVFPCEFAGPPNTCLPWTSFLWAFFLLCYHFVLPLMGFLVLVPSWFNPRLS